MGRATGIPRCSACDPRLDHWDNPGGPGHGRSRLAAPPPRPWYRTRLGRYIHARLHRRIFVWFGLSILVTGLVVSTVMNLVGGSTWRQEMEQAARLRQQPLRRGVGRPRSSADALVQGIAARPGRGPGAAWTPSGALLAPRGRGLSDTPDYSVPVHARRASCWARWRPATCASRPRRPWRLLLPLLLTGTMLWMLSGAIARRLTRPMDELVRAASELGAGKLETRVELGRGATGEMGVLAEAFNDMAARIERQMADQRELLAAVSHELRTPLARMRVLTEILRDGGGDPKTLDKVDREVVELDALVGELLASSRLDFGQVTSPPARLPRSWRPGRWSGRDCLRSCCRWRPRTRPWWPTRRCWAGRSPTSWTTRGEHGQGAEALQDLRARGAAWPSVWTIAAPGCSPARRRASSQPFYRKDRGAEAREAGSLGLGLALVQRIARAHGGEVVRGEPARRRRSRGLQRPAGRSTRRSWPCSSVSGGQYGPTSLPRPPGPRGSATRRGP